MKKVLAILAILGLVLAGAAEAKVLTFDWGYDASSSADQKWQGYTLTWATGGVADSLYTSILSDSTATDTDTTNAFNVAGLFSGQSRTTTTADTAVVAALIFRAVADTTIDSLSWILDYSYDGDTWFAGTNWSLWVSLPNGAGVDTTFVKLIRAGSAIVSGGETMAPLWRLRVKCMDQMEATHAQISGAVQLEYKKLKKLYAWFWAGGR